MTLEQIIEEAVKESEEIIERLVCASYDAPNNLHITSKELMIEKGKEVFESFLTSTITKSVERVLETEKAEWKRQIRESREKLLNNRNLMLVRLLMADKEQEIFLSKEIVELSIDGVIGTQLERAVKSLMGKE